MDELFLRKAEADDSHELWEWRNHPEIRKWSFTKDPIPFEEHQKWFEQRMNNSKYLILVACGEKKQKFGQIRFDIDRKKNIAHVNVHLNPQYFNKGLGSRIISKGTQFLHKQYPLMKICAEILIDNVASQKAFVKNGYVLDGKNEGGGQNKQCYYFGAQVL